MPASQEVEFRQDGFTGRVDPVDHPDPMYYTDENPEFRITLSNQSEKDFVEGSAITWCVAVGDGMPDPVYVDQLEIELLRGETKEYIVKSGLLAFEGHGVFGLVAGGDRGQGDSPERVLSSGRVGGGYNPAYTFSVWDREHYDVIHGQTKRLQRWALAASILIGVSSIIQVLTIFFR